MERISLGRTGLTINRCGFDGMPIQSVAEDQAVETVRHAIEQGVDFIDTSRASATRERRIGRALKLTDKKVVLASKSVGRTSGDIQADLGKSLSELQVEHIDVFCRRCDYCLPCSEDIPISVVLHVRSIVKRMGKESVNGAFLSPAIAAARRCTECGECLERCPYDLPIPDLIQENLQWVDREMH